MSKKKELIKNTLIVAAGKISTQMVSFLLIPFYTLLLSPYEYGYVDLATTYIVLLAPIIALQIDRASLRYLIESRGRKEKEKEIISNSILIIINMVIISICALFVLSFFIKITNIKLIAITIITIIFSNLFLQFARGMGGNKKFAIANILGSITTLTSNVVFVFLLHKGIAGVFISMILSNLIILIYTLMSMKIYQYIKINSLKKEVRKKLIKYSLPLVPSGLSWWAINVSDRTIVSLMINVTANGIYAIANKYTMIFNAIYSIFDMTWTESASLHINAKDKNEFFSDVFNNSIKIFTSLNLLLIAILPFIFNIIINEKFSESYQYIPILLTASLMSAMVAQYSAIYVAKKMTKKVLTTSIMAAAINITLNLVFIQSLGLYATSISTVVAFFTMAIFRHFDTKKYVKIKYEKFLIPKIICFYIIVIFIFYLNNPALNIINFLAMILFITIINRHIITSSKNKLTNRLRNLK